jgi:hypothetical protein
MILDYIGIPVAQHGVEPALVVPEKSPTGTANRDRLPE